VTGYNIACLILTLLTVSFVPAIIACHKNHRFSRWYVYSVLLFPIALVHAVLLKKPRYLIGVYIYDEKAPSKRRKRLYSAVPRKKGKPTLKVKYLCAVFFSKLIFGACVAIACFALFRTFANDSAQLRSICVTFALVFSVLLSVVEVLRLSRIPMIADEVTKRSIIMAFLSLACSVPIIVVRELILDKILPEHGEFVMFICIVTSFVLFVIALLSQQRKYYSFFNRFFDYCTISLFSYIIFAAATLIWVSLARVSWNAECIITLPMQILSLDYFSSVGYIKDISRIYSVALIHSIILLVIFISGLMCREFKRKEREFRVEYRSKAFRMSRRRILRRHIPEARPMEKI